MNHLPESIVLFSKWLGFIEGHFDTDISVALICCVMMALMMSNAGGA